MEFLNSFLSAFGNVNFEVIAQLTMLGLVLVSGPVVIFLLAARGGDL